MPGRVFSSHCPQCYSTLNGADDPCSEDAPQLGDITICFYCGALLCFGLGMALENYPEAELTEDLLVRVQAMRAAAMLTHGGKFPKQQKGKH